MKTAEQILAEAADLVEYSGRWVNRFPQRLDETCALFALFEDARRRRSVPSAAERAALEAVGRELGGCRESADDDQRLAIFNDSPGRTKEEVAAVLRNAKRWLRVDGAA